MTKTLRGRPVSWPWVACHCGAKLCRIAPHSEVEVRCAKCKRTLHIIFEEDALRITELRAGEAVKKT